MSDFPQEGDLDPVADDTANGAEPEDRQADAYDNFDDALAALADDDEGDEPEEHTEAPEAEEEPEGDEAPAETMIRLSDGTEITLKELEAGNLRQSDYSRKMADLKRDRDAAEKLRGEYSQRHSDLETVLRNFQQFAEGLIPPEPTLQLAQQNPGEYQYQLAMRNAVLAEIQQVYDMREGAAALSKEAQDAEIARFLEGEDIALQKLMPALKDPARLAKFKDDNMAFAREMGVPDEVLSQPQPSYVQNLLHYARLGHRAEQNRANAQRRIAEAPKKGAEAHAASRPSKSREAMKRLAKSGSIRDAMSIDFD